MSPSVRPSGPRVPRPIHGRLRESIVPGLAFLAVVAAGRALPIGHAAASSTGRAEFTLPNLPREIGRKPLLVLVGPDAIVRISTDGSARYYSVFDRSGVTLAAGLTRELFTRSFPRIKLDAMRDLATGAPADRTLLADTPE
jgi:hypothetical protein